MLACVPRDYDAYNNGSGWEISGSSHLDYDTCEWTGEGLSDYEGYFVVWDRSDIGPTGPSGATIEFTADDYTSSPTPVYPGESINDVPYETDIKMYAYQCVAYLNCSSSNSGSPSTGPIYETSNGYDCITLNLTESEVEAYVNTNYIEDEDELDAYGSATWYVDTSPDIATLDGDGELKVGIDAVVAGKFYARAWDDDVFNGGEASVSFPLGIIDIGFSTSGDNMVALAGMGFAFGSSGELGSDTSDKIELVSNGYQYFDWEEEPFFYASPDNYLQGSKLKEATASAIIEGEVYAAATWGGLIMAKSIIKTTGQVEYFISDPNYVNGGNFTENEDWPL